MKKVKKLYLRSFLITAGLLLISFAILAGVFVGLSYRFILNEKRDTMRANANEVARSVAAFSRDGSIWDFELRMSISAVAESTDLRVLVCAASGSVVSCSDNPSECTHIGRVIPEEMLSAAMGQEGYYGLTELDGVLEEQCYVVGVPMTYYGSPFGYVFVASGRGELTEMWRSLAIIFLIVAGAVLVIAFIGTILMAREQTKPLNDMAQAAHRFAHGEFDARVQDTGRQDEIGELTRAFNSMAESLDISEKRRSEFIANISHELKTPMTTITGFADGILDGTVPDGKRDEYLGIISAEAKRLSRLVRRMLETSRLQAMEPAEVLRESFDASEVIRVAILSLEGKINAKGLDVDVSLPEEEVTVRGDKDAITQVVYNLIENAAKFAYPGSALGVSMEVCGEKAYVTVRDTGDTIPPQELPLIFDRFHKTDRSRSMDRDGVGLGLYIVKTIINNHKEDITVTSRDGVTEFKFSLTVV